MENIHGTEHPTKKQARNTAELSKILASPRLLGLFQFSVCLDVLDKGRPFSLDRAGKGYL
jgi:hypothetical protein